MESVELDEERVGPCVSMLDAIRHRLSHARVESVNTPIRLLTRIAFGLHSSGPLIAWALLALGGLCPALPGRV